MNPKVSLLIVDDDPVFAAYAQQLVRSLRDSLPADCNWVDTAEKAIEELQTTAYDLVLLDYHLPGANGLEFLKRIRELPSEVQPAVIMLTASGNEAIAVEAMKRGALDYLTKADLDVAPLTRALRCALTQKQLADQVALYNDQMRADLEMARRLQQSMLPEVYPSFSQDAPEQASALRFFHRYCPAAELAGDFFSVLRLSDTMAAIFICDVMGHGIRSALITAMMRALVDGEAPRAHDPGAFLAAMNRRLMTLIRPDEEPMFATACHVIVDLANATLRYATAGHPRPIHLQNQPGAVQTLGNGAGAGPALGLFPDAVYSCGEAAIAAGDVLLLFTDGVYEVSSPGGGDEFGRRRLLESVRRHRELAPELLCDAVINEVREFGGGADFADDVCLLCVQVERLQAGGK
jgi:sigma-B regulation protein RsbU (phosphoserine phosphatase)